MAGLLAAIRTGPPWVSGPVAIATSATCIVTRLFAVKKCSQRENVILLRNDTEKASELKMRISEIFNQIDQRIPKVTFIDKDNTTSAANSKVFIIKPQNRYCVGDQLTVQVDVYDYLGKRKTYGGDYLRATITNPDKRAGSSGRIEDFNNGTYHIHFTLFWDGKVVVTVNLMHPSEAVSSLWKSRNSWYGIVDYTGKFTSKDKAIETKCGFALDKKEELCEYADHEDEEYFYCVKPKDFSCGSLTELRSTKTYASQLSELENSLLTTSNVRVEIPGNILAIEVVLCNGSSLEKKEHCKIGMGLEYPSGHVMEDIWYPKGCIMKTYHSEEEMNTCMTGKFIYMFGDSTVLQWMKYFEEKVKTLHLLNVHETGWTQQHLGVDVARNIYVQWKRHGNPFINLFFLSNRGERSIPREIDIIGGGEHTVIVFTLGIHFRFYPVHHYIRRLLNIRRAIERLFLRSPETKVIIKTENTVEMTGEFEGLSDFHGYIHYFIMEKVFKDVNVGFVNGWDMTTAFNTNAMHPPEHYIRNEVDMLMTYLCT